MTESIDCMATLREAIVKTLLRGLSTLEILSLVERVEKLTLRDMCTDYIQQAGKLYREATDVAREGTQVALRYAEICNARGDAYTQAAAMIHNSVESRWPAHPGEDGVTFCNGNGE